MWIWNAPSRLFSFRKLHVPLNTKHCTGIMHSFRIRPLFPLLFTKYQYLVQKLNQTRNCSLSLPVTSETLIDPLPQRIFELFGQQNPKLDFQNSRLYLGRTLTLCFVKIKILPKQWLIVQCMYAMYTSC